MRIKVDIDTCTGCKLCELSCSMAHSPDNSINYELSAIRIFNDPFHRKDVAYVCYQCKKAHCLDMCSTGALYREDGIIKVDNDNCSGCDACIDACPFDRIWLSSQGKIIKCDLCDGLDYQYCIKNCPVDAISLAGRNLTIRK